VGVPAAQLSEPRSRFLQPCDHLGDASLQLTHMKEKIFRVGVRLTQAFDTLARAVPAEELVEDSHAARP
jgi:hypothetical protein